jgi:hypothetical protein
VPAAEARGALATIFHSKAGGFAYRAEAKAEGFAAIGFEGERRVMSGFGEFLAEREDRRGGARREAEPDAAVTAEELGADHAGGYYIGAIHFSTFCPVLGIDIAGTGHR